MNGWSRFLTKPMETFKGGDRGDTGTVLAGDTSGDSGAYCFKGFKCIKCIIMGLPEKRVLHRGGCDS